MSPTSFFSPNLLDRTDLVRDWFEHGTRTRRTAPGSINPGPSGELLGSLVVLQHERRRAIVRVVVLDLHLWVELRRDSGLFGIVLVIATRLQHLEPDGLACRRGRYLLALSSHLQYEALRVGQLELSQLHVAAPHRRLCCRPTVRHR